MNGLPSLRSPKSAPCPGVSTLGAPADGQVVALGEQFHGRRSVTVWEGIGGRFRQERDWSRQSPGGAQAPLLSPNRCEP